MYLYIPSNFLVPISYVKISDLNIKNFEIFHELDFYGGSINRFDNRKNILIGVCFITLGGRWDLDKETMETYAKEKDVSLKFEVADFNLDKQISQIENLISEGIDVLIILPINVLATASAIEKAKKSGVKVISYDVLAQSCDLDFYIAFNNLRIGELQSRYLVEHVPKGNYIFLYGEPQSEFKEGAMEYLQPLVNIGSIKIVAYIPVRNWNTDIAFKEVDSVLTANNNRVNAILAPNDQIAGAAIEALKKHNLAGMVAVTGQDADLPAIKRIIEGTQSMTVFKDTKILAKKAIDASIALVNGAPLNVYTNIYNGKMYVPTNYVEPISIDKNNIDSVLIKGGYYKKEQIYEREIYEPSSI